MAESDRPAIAEVDPGTDPASGLIASFAWVLFKAGGTKATLQAVVDLAVQSIEGCDYAGIFISHAGKVAGSVRTDPIVTEIDNLQLQTGQGPCLDAIAQQTVCYAEDLTEDQRWPQFSSAVSRVGLRGVLALYLGTDGTIGALNLYAHYPSAFGAVDRARAVILAGLAGLAISRAESTEKQERRADNLLEALATRELVGQAQGILMERERITAPQAFDVLRRASHHLDRKLREVAQDLVETGERPRTDAELSPEARV